MTVSRVINGETNVRDKTRALVMEAVRDLKYVPNPAARRLAGSENFRIGLIYSNPSISYLSAFLVGALDEAGRKATQIVLEKSDMTEEAQLSAVKKLILSGVDGVILPPPLGEARPILKALRTEGIPIATVASGSDSQESICVRINDYAAAHDMARYLLKLGHRRIGFINGPDNQSSSADRRLGFLQAQLEAGIDQPPEYMTQGNFDFRSGLNAAEKLLLLPETKRPTAIFASNDDMAAACVSVAHRHGLDVPGDLSVVGFDDTAIATTVWPELTTIHQPVAVMAESALGLIIQAVRDIREDGQWFPRNQLAPHALVRRGSAAAPRA